MQNFIEQQIRKIITENTVEVNIDTKGLAVHGIDYVETVRELVDLFIQADLDIKAHMIQEFESRVPEEKTGTTIQIPCPDGISGCLVSHSTRVISTEDNAFNECRSIMLEEINKLKNE